MVQFSSLFEGLARGVSSKARSIKNDKEREAADSLADEARKNHLIVRCPGAKTARSNATASVFSKKGEKGINQDCLTVWEEFGCQQDMTFCGIFDGHGPLGHFVAKCVNKSLPSLLLRNWQDFLAVHSLEFDLDAELNHLTKKARDFSIWKQAYLRTCSVIDQELERHPRVDSFDSGTTALAIVRQGETLTVANVGDSRAVLATMGESGKLVPVQLTVDFKPNLPQEAERIGLSRGLVSCSHDEPGVYRLWQPNKGTPGLALSRAFGDHCMKDFGLISEPEVTERHITNRDQFAILATDGVWDVLSNEEAVQIVSSAPTREKSAKRLVKYAAHAWKSKRPGVAMDDISAICMYFHGSLTSYQVQRAHKSCI
ncbi:hypothetical protein BVRB_3g048220 [Beta vulgaris subsp. vulgaris]|uniref:probable protein phosphatase 2C 34 isoform X2 n=1 Tax=Beta vulgaris subsp. vulgaris TaxID=3555 RepID=UPI00053F7D23|nr:probable protein phosphatase 2C 34 isoform X2 [Beta vulgaris subsp. vulgaris]XP_010670937.1 probable protein phosphatase 2C 34 isoform X2 [Beta vulgaris subsp. vulgaris]XP_048496672.1 probable protein phosphatase 2C 34 isoform X2 [Beta vulgaris subsp. vulgaris]XP_048496673.1 probable protein phosphatase 2C 34 isoform X2 [Beta vulgaris subsp. vulgaris]KMT16528.1 hypothetical protein BVRB_3g048220 [Beta vulgaris subsp. vulgaris]